MKKRIVILAALLALTLSGCAAVNARLGKRMLKKSGVADMAEYEQYLQYEQNGLLDEKGFAKEGLPEEQEIPEGRRSFPAHGRSTMRSTTGTRFRSARCWTASSAIALTVIPTSAAHRSRSVFTAATWTAS